MVFMLRNQALHLPPAMQMGAHLITSLTTLARCSQVCVERVMSTNLTTRSRVDAVQRHSCLILVGAAPSALSCFIHRAVGSPLTFLHSSASHSSHLICGPILLYAWFQYKCSLLVEAVIEAGIFRSSKWN